MTSDWSPASSLWAAPASGPSSYTNSRDRQGPDQLVGQSEANTCKEDQSCQKAPGGVVTLRLDTDVHTSSRFDLKQRSEGFCVLKQIKREHLYR